MRNAWFSATALLASRSARSGSENVSSCHWKIGKVLGQRAEHGVGCRHLRQLDAVPAELAGAADLVRSAEGAGDDLAAEADAEHGAVLPLEVAQQFEKLWKIGILLVGQRILAAAKHHRSVMPVGIVGQGSPRCARRKSISAPASASAAPTWPRLGIVIVLDDENPQRQSPDNPALPNRCRSLIMRGRN